MIEVIYKEEKQEAKGNEGMFAVPRNIRQIGLSSENYRIYVEDYVYTFLVRLAGMGTEGEKEKGRLAVLTGESRWQAGVTYIFVKGALTVDKTEAAADHIDFTESAWKKINDEQELYFTGQEIVGWFFAQSELPMEITEVFRRVHLKYFGGWEKVLMLMDPAEREDAFFHYENNFLVRQPGYYLFYEKNPQMQNYMLDKNQEVQLEKTEEVPDEAVVAFRKIIRSKKKSKRVEEKKETEDVQDIGQEGRPSVFSYAATACLAIALLAVGVNFYRDYRDGYGVYEEVSTASASAEKTDGKGENDKAKITGQGVTVTPVLKKTEENVKTENDSADDKSDGGNSLQEEENSKTAQNTGALSTDSDNRQNIEPGETGEEVSQTEAAGQKASQTEVSDREASQAKAAGQETSQTDASGQGTNSSGQETQAYQEESDVRKAVRKETLAEQSAAAEAEEAGQNQETSGKEVHNTYVIRPGDTLYQISIEKYGSMNAISEICELNGISPEEIIYPGQVIVLP